MVESRQTFKVSEVKAFLEKDGYSAGTSAFENELHRRYESVEGIKGQFYERHDWQGDRPRCSQAK